MNKILENKEVKVKEVAPKVLSVEEQARLDTQALADARVVAVKDRITAAKLVRDEQEKAGVAETEGAKLDREAAEALELKEATNLNPAQLLVDDFHREDLNALRDRVNEHEKTLKGN